ncbi:unnamed protein product, partial [Chrysoparadoxa australica]
MILPYAKVTSATPAALGLAWMMQTPMQRSASSKKSVMASSSREQPGKETCILATSSAKQGESPLAKLVISGGVSWVFELIIGHYFEFLKIVKQTKKGTYLQLTKEMVHQKGIAGIWDGYFPWGSVQAIAKGGVFGWGHAFSKRRLEPLVRKGTISKDFAEIAAGGLGGGFQGLVLSPTLLLKTRVMTDPVFRNNMSVWETSKQSAIVGLRVMKNEGMAGLMKGSLTFSMKRVADWTTRFFFAEAAGSLLFKRGNADYKLTFGEKISASLIGGSLSALSTIPIDVMVAQMQQASKAGEKVSIVETFKRQHAKGGMEGLVGFATRGFCARVAHVALTT